MLLERVRSEYDREASADQIADTASQWALLTCLIRELALPNDWVRYEWPADMKGIDLAGRSGEGTPLLIALPDGAYYFVIVDRRDKFGSHRYVSNLWGREPYRAWRQLDLSDFAHDLLDRCAGAGVGNNSDLLSQILSGREALGDILREVAATAPDPLVDYVASEQAVWFGHPVHPAPKARNWIDASDELRFAPEHGMTFRLHRWEVDTAGLHIRSNGLDAEAVLASVADQAGAAPDKAILSLHPAQAKLLLRDVRVRDRLDRGQIRDLGVTGRFARALASVRTVSNDGGDHILKTSLAIRITNCVRKNAWYELESAVIVDRILAELVARDPDGCGGLSVIREPASLGWAPSDATGEEALWFREQTGVILRRDFRLDHHEGGLLACTVFGRDTLLRPLVTNLIGTEAAELRRWFGAYAARLLRPVLTAFFRHGIVFEPHLQNCVILIRDGLPVRVLLRDFEGVKLTAEHGMDLVDEMIPARVQASLAYPRERGWQRVAYCLFVNNLSEAILALTHRKPDMAPSLWAIVADELETIRADLGREAPELDALLAGGPIPAKANFRTRLAAAPDREARYVELGSPWSAVR